MKSQTHNLGIQSKEYSTSIAEQSRFLISQNRQKQQNRQLSMLYRLASEVGTGF